MSGLGTTVCVAVLPILPAVPSLLVMLGVIGSALVTGVLALRHPSARRMVLTFLWRQKWSLLILAVLGMTTVMAYDLVTQRTVLVGDILPAVAGDWSHRGGLARTGAVADAPTPVNGGIQWVGGVGHAFFASPAVVGDRVYGVGFQGDRGRIFCWDAHDGRLLWSASPPGFRAAFSSPVIVGERLLVGEGLHHTTNAALYCLDLRAGHEGEVLWTHRTSGHVEGTPVIDKGRVFFTAGDDGVYCVHLAGSNAGQLVWHRGGENYPDVETSLAVDAGQVYLGLGKGGEAVVVLDAETGDEIVRLPMSAPVYSPPAVNDQRLYVGMGTGDYLNYNNSSGRVVGIDRTTHEIVWTFDTGGTVLGAIVVEGGEVLFASVDGWVRQLDEAGRLLREWNSHAPIVAAPAVGEDVICVVNESGLLYALDRGTLEVMWETRLGSAGHFFCSPVLAHGHVYVGTEQDGFLCVGRPTSTNNTHRSSLGSLDEDVNIASIRPVGLLWEAAIESASTAKMTVDRYGDVLILSTASRLSVRDAVTGRVLWSVTSSGVGRPVIDGKYVWLGRADGGPNTAKSANSANAESWTCRSLVDGHSVENKGVPSSFEKIEKEIFEAEHSSAGLSVDAGRLLFQRATDSEPRLLADVTTLSGVTSRHVVIRHPVIADGRIYLLVNDDRLVCLGDEESR